jgi:hypothetical protein
MDKIIKEDYLKYPVLESNNIVLIFHSLDLTVYRIRVYN